MTKAICGNGGLVDGQRASAPRVSSESRSRLLVASPRAMPGVERADELNEVV